MKKACLEIFITFKDQEPTRGLVELYLELIARTAEPFFQLDHPELEVESVEGDIDYHNED